MSYHSENSSDSPSKPAFSNSPDDQLHAVEEEEFWLVRGIPFFVVGKRLYGVVDTVPGVLYVATFFYHVFWVPLVPVESWILVTDSHGYGEARNVPIRMSWKSVVVAWTRALSVISGTIGMMASVGALLFVVSGQAGVTEFVIVFVCALIAIGLYWFTLAIRVASPAKAEQLAVQAGFQPGASRELIDTAIGSAFESVECEPVTMRCPSCGRMLSSTSRICPRCEHRFR